MAFHRMLCRRTTKQGSKAPLLQRCVEHRTAMSAIFLKKIRFTIRQKTTDKFSWRSAQSLPLTAVSLPILKAATPGFFPARTIPPLWRIKFISIPLTCTPEGAARLEIRRVSDGTLLSCTDLDCIRGTLFVEDQTLLLAGECPEGTQLQLFRYFRSIQPRFTAHADPERRLSGRLESRGSPAGRLPISCRRHRGFHSCRL